MNPEELDAIRARHRQLLPREYDVACACGNKFWPCDAVRLLDALSEAEEGVKSCHENYERVCAALSEAEAANESALKDVMAWADLETLKRAERAEERLVKLEAKWREDGIAIREREEYAIVNIDEFKARAEAAEAELERVRAALVELMQLHNRRTGFTRDGETVTACTECHHEAPCETVRILVSAALAEETP